MKILLCSTGFNSFKKNTIGIFQLDQALALKRKQYDVRIASIDVRSIRRIRRFRTYTYEANGIRCATSNFPLGPLPFYRMTSYICSQLARKVYGEITKDGWKPDIVHAHFCGAASSFSDIVKEKNIPFIVTEHFSKMNEEKISSKMLYNAQKAYSAASAIISVSNKLKQSIAVHTGYDSVVIPNIVDVDVFSVKENKKTNPFTFITAGRLVEIKKIDILIKAFSDLKYNPRLIILGAGPELRKLKQLVDKLQLSDRVFFFGKYKREEFNTYLGRANCFVLPSRSETFGVVLAEAMAAGVPVITTKCGGPEDFVNSENGIIVPVNNIEQLTQAMSFMMENINQYNVNNISNFVKEKFSSKSVVDQIEDVYRRVLTDGKVN